MKIKDPILENIKKIKAQIQQNPSLLEDDLFIFENIKYIPIKYNKFSEKMRNNDIFTFYYFSQKEADSKEYKYIKKELLENEIFIINSLKFNPDLYFLMSPKIDKEKIYNYLSNTHEEDILKYASKEKLDDVLYCKNIITKNYHNYQFASEEVRGNPDVFIPIIKYYPQTIEFLPKKILNNKEYIKSLVFSHNIDIFRYLPEEYYNDNSFIIQALKRDSNLIHTVAKHIENLDNILINLLNTYNVETKKYNFLTDGKFSLTTLLPYFPPSFFTSEFCEKYKSFTSDAFIYLSKEHRTNPHIIKTLFLNKEWNTFNLEKINAINNDELKSFIKSVRSDKNFFKSKDKINVIVSYINSYILKEKLEVSITENNTKCPIRKI